MSDYRFRCTSDFQAGQRFYSGSIKFGLLQQLIKFADPGLEAEDRSQRPLDEKHAQGIAKYVTSNPKQYILPAITLSLNGKGIKFQPLADDPDMGYLIVPARAIVSALDGQHRAWASGLIAESVPELENEAIPVTFHVNLSVAAVRQYFRDINLTPKKVSTALALFFDQRDPEAQIARALLKQVPAFKLVEKDRDTLSPKSPKLFQFNAIYQANQLLLCAAEDDASLEQQLELSVTYWKAVAVCFPEWEQVLKKKTAASDIRAAALHTHAIALVAIGKLGAFLIKHYPDDWEYQLAGLEHIDWSKSNPAWVNRIMFGGSIRKSNSTITALLCYLKLQLNVALTQDEQAIEQQVQRHQGESHAPT